MGDGRGGGSFKEDREKSPAKVTRSAKALAEKKLCRLQEVKKFMWKNPGELREQN